MNTQNRAKRTCWRQEEKNILKLSFEHNPNPDVTELNRLAQIVNKDTDRVLNWFKNERARLRRHGLEPIQGFLMAKPRDDSQLNNSNNSSLKLRRDRVGRVFWTKRARARLVQFYEDNRTPNFEQIVGLAMELNTEPVKIQNWIKNHRQRERERARGTRPPLEVQLPIVNYKEDEEIDVEEIDEPATSSFSSSESSAPDSTEVPNKPVVKLPAVQQCPVVYPNPQHYAMMTAMWWQRQLAFAQLQRFGQTFQKN